MTAGTISSAEWLDFAKTEYLDGFVRDGGASIKFSVDLSEQELGVDRALIELAAATGYLTASVNASETRVHMIDQVFFRIADQIPWRELSLAVLASLAKKRGIPNPARPGNEEFLLRLAEANNVDAEMLGMEARNWIADSVLRKGTLIKDFRVAMTHLCLAELFGGPDGDIKTDAILDWLTGRNKAVSAVKPYQIYSRITRNNARLMFESLLRWIQFAGFSGMVVTLDISRLTVSRNPQDGFIYYSKAQLLDAYEVLRQYVDGTDRLNGCLIMVVAAPEFLDVVPSSSCRGLGAYDALKFRVYDEVHDQRLVNPMGSLIRFSGDGSHHE